MISQISVDCHVEEKHLSGTKQSYCKVRLCGSSAAQQCHTDVQHHTTSVTHPPGGWGEAAAALGTADCQDGHSWAQLDCQDGQYPAQQHLSHP